jgi:outer membrane protein
VNGNKVRSAGIAITTCALLLLDYAVEAQSSVLSLRQAVEIALEKNPVRKAAQADRRVSSSEIKQAKAGFLPAINFAESFTRGNDPVYVFGTKLRQRRFTLADFSLNRLNTPTPLNNFSSRFEGQWTLFNSGKNQLALSRAKLVEDVAEQRLERTDQELIAHVINSYLALLLSRRQMKVAEDAVRTSESLVETSSHRVEAGLVIESDLLSARVNLAQRRQESIQARSSVSLAEAQLVHDMGLPAGSAVDVVDTQTERALPDAQLKDFLDRALSEHPDLRRLALEEQAQNKAIAISKADFGPKLALAAGWQTDGRSFLNSSGNSWITGAELTIDLFSGGAKSAALAREKAVGERLSAMREAMRSDIQLQVQRAYYEFDTARQQLEVARTSVAQAKESLRIIQNRYDSGLATITDVLRAEDAARRTETDYWEAAYRVRSRYANLELASGTLSIHSPVVAT